jgi:hypothetical protein
LWLGGHSGLVMVRTPVLYDTGELGVSQTRLGLNGSSGRKWN